MIRRATAGPSRVGRGVAAALLAALLAPAAHAATVRCESVGGRSSSCDLPGDRGAVLERQLGGAPCEYGRNWTWDGRRVRVEENCRGEFRSDIDGFELGQSVLCDSKHRQIHRCPADTRAGALIEDLNFGCELDRTWGFDAEGVWVSGRCEASFRVGVAPYDGRTVQCDWIQGGPRRFCAFDTSGGVLLEASTGSAACLFGETWGYADGGLWVDRGCSGQFRADSLRTTGGFGAPPVALACASAEGDVQFCAAGGTLSALILTDASGGRCREARSWDDTAHGIWVANGCVGLFQINH
jgi:hypothetical protein